MKLQLLGFPGEMIYPEQGVWVERYLCEVLPGVWAMLWNDYSGDTQLGFFTDEYIRGGKMPGGLVDNVDIESPIQASALIYEFIKTHGGGDVTE